MKKELTITAMKDGTVIDHIPARVVFKVLRILNPQEHKNMLDSIQKGDEVVTSGGILGKVSKLTDSFIVLNVGSNVEMKFQKHAVTATLPKGTIKAVNE